MEPIANFAEKLLASRRAMKAATIGGTALVSGDVLYIAASEATANGTAGMIAGAASLLTAECAYLWHAATDR